MSKRYKRQNLDSNLFHHGLIKLLLVHHLKTLGQDWNGFIDRNGFVAVNPVETPVGDKPLIEKPLGFSSVKLDFLYENPHEKALPDQSLCEQHDVSSRVIKTPEHEQIACPNPTVKNNKKHSRKQPKKNQEIGFRNKRTSRLISRSLQNRSKAHVCNIPDIKSMQNRNKMIEMAE